MRVIGWIGVLHVVFIVAWMVINVIFGILNPVTLGEGDSNAEIGVSYYINFPGFLGLDHGSKALVMLTSVLLPIGLFMYLKKKKDFMLLNLIALIAGCIGFAFYGASLMLQATAAEYAFNLYGSSDDVFARSFSVFLYEWSMLEGGLSVSIYIIANLFLAAWVIIHSRGLHILDSSRKLSMFGYIVGFLQIIGYLISWFFLMQANQNMHDFNEGVGLLFMVWILIISIKMIRGKITI
ncbi:hypothetical protein SAMN05216238_107121 [Lentibacillus persicus]|uniref:DUF998 domain-containing protein n=1 Tax=Lentibacillus persicus TaxID=640948 RepID=A0A1I1XAV4_9BACI|nr:hypothetical protein [Lentibacillus persicus]SFE02863.1 hypothetical protein SAMN05216238_107121 [Lentibacillus persicus]